MGEPKKGGNASSGPLDYIRRSISGPRPTKPKAETDTTSSETMPAVTEDASKAKPKRSDSFQEKKATTLQSMWRGRNARKDKKKKPSDTADAAVKMQAAWRGKKVRGNSRASPAAKAALIEGEDGRTGMRPRMAGYLYPDQANAVTSLGELEKALNAKMNLGSWYDEARKKGTQSGSAEGDSLAEFTRRGAGAASQTTTTDEDLAKEHDAKIEAAITTIQVRWRLSRKHLLDDDTLVAAAPPPSRLLQMAIIGAVLAVTAGAAFYMKDHPKTYPMIAYAVGYVRSIVTASASGIINFVLTTIWVIIGLIFAIYAWLRMPSWLGTIVSEIVTRIALNGLESRMETARVKLWITYNPLTLHADIHATNAYLSNPECVQARSKYFVFASHLHFICNTELTWLKRCFKGLPNRYPLTPEGEPACKIVVKFPHVVISGVEFNMIIGRTGLLNTPSLGRQLNENELRAAIGGKGIHMYRNVTLPNVFRIQILAARQLMRLPNLKPRIEVNIRNMSLSTGRGRKGEEDGTTFYSFGTEMIFPTPDLDACVIVRVLNDNVGAFSKPALIGQWFMSLKYLICIEGDVPHCKHKSVKMHGDGAISGTFLLTDAKCHGSACRDPLVGYHNVPGGFSGELDMAMQWTSTSPLETAEEQRAHRKPLDAFKQLDTNSEEDKLKMGYFPELKQYLYNVPIRFDIDFMTIRKARVDLSDLFVGVKTGDAAMKDSGGGNVVIVNELNFKPFVDTTLYSFLEVLMTQTATRVLQDRKALATAVTDVASGLAENLSRIGKYSLSPMNFTKKSKKAGKAPAPA